MQDRIAELAAARNEKLEIDAQLVLLELYRIASVDLLAVLNDDGTIKDLHDIPVDTRRAIAKFEVESKLSGTRTRVQFWNKLNALELLCQHMGLLTSAASGGAHGTRSRSPNIELAADIASILREARRRRVAGVDLV